VIDLACGLVVPGTPRFAAIHADSSCAELAPAAKQWNELMKTDLANLNGELVKQGLSAPAGVPVDVPDCPATP